MMLKARSPVTLVPEAIRATVAVEAIAIADPVEILVVFHPENPPVAQARHHPGRLETIEISCRNLGFWDARAWIKPLASFLIKIIFVRAGSPRYLIIINKLNKPALPI
ncbi:hypothetical protein BCD67_04935 [Oscillatoriales cyanobacterium USR001]|nr:hypothetical protein BCD67_04935 [Oscillatoriales cyanobacterium USR001]